MRKWLDRILLMILLTTGTVVHAQFDPNKVCRVEDGNLIFTLDKRWNDEQRQKISGMFNLDSALLSDAFALKPMQQDSCYIWKTRKLDVNRIELILEPCKITPGEGEKDQIILVDDQFIKYDKAPAVDLESVLYGVNRLTRTTVVQLSADRVRFFLPGHRNAKKVFLSGSFNAWSTLQTPMIPNDSGWAVTLKLRSGKHTYKYIIDGKWTNDSYNKLRETDTYRGYNNIFFCYNYRFILTGYPDAKKVIVAGSFNNWNTSALRMIRFQGKWVLPIYLREGTHAYKFIVDGQWITDPGNKVTRPDGRGNKNSFMAIGDTLYFTLKGFPGAKRVIVSGDFNGWNHEELSMEKTAAGWTLPYVLAAGNYQYKFIVDGKWITDPANPYTSGEDDFMNSCLAVKPNYWFRLDDYPNVSNVIVTGSFNNWSHTDYRMERRQGTWWFPMYLKPGKYTYKFVVDKKWIQDPANSLWEENEFGTGNSVLWIEP